MKRLVITILSAVLAACVGRTDLPPDPFPDPTDPHILMTDFTLTGTKEVPPVITIGFGEAKVAFNLMTYRLWWEIDQNLDLTECHFHGPADQSMNAPIQVYIEPVGFHMEGAVVLESDQVEEILMGLWYLNCHSFLHPDGIIRGQVVFP